MHKKLSTLSKDINEDLSLQHFSFLYQQKNYEHIKVMVLQL